MPTQAVNLYDFRPSDSNNDTALILAAVAEINKINSTALNIQFPRRTLDLETVPVITGKNVTLNGFGCILRSPDARFFQLGDDDTKALNVNITGFQLWCQNKLDPFSDPPTSATDSSYDTDPNPAHNNFAIVMHNADYCKAGQFVCTGLASAIKFGSNPTGPLPNGTTASRCIASEWLGDCNNGINSNANILVLNGSGSKVININLAGIYTGAAAVSGVSPARVGGSVNGALLKIAPLNGAIVDTWEFKVLLAIFNSVTSTNGKPLGVHIDRRYAPVTNIWFQSGNCIDHSEKIAFWFQANTVANNAYSRNIVVESTRFATDAGRGVLIDNNSGSILQSCIFDKIFVGIQTDQSETPGVPDYAFESKTPGNSSEVTLSNSRIIGTGVQKTRAVKMGGNGWSCFNNKVRGSNEPQNFNSGYQFIGNGTEHDNEFQSPTAYPTNPTTPTWTIP
jgi:hypothetical protein